MSGWLLLFMCFAVWLLGGMAQASERAVMDARRGIPKGQRGGVSLAPIIPLFPLGFWILALFVDSGVPPWGTVVVAGFHAVLGVLFLVSIGRDRVRLRSLDKNYE